MNAQAVTAAPRSAEDIAAAVTGGGVTAAAMTERALSLIAAADPGLNCFTATFAAQARSAAGGVDARRRRGEPLGPLAGVPFAVKNLFDVQGTTTLAGSIIEAGKPPARTDSTLVARLKAAGAVLVGALNMDEYAYGFTTENAHYGATRNPHDPSRVSGGSSGGSAAAVAAGLVPITLGSDTNGSIRVPAALCGVYGLKPTFGRLSRQGVTPFVHSLDHTGPFAATVGDLALTYDVLQGPDPADPACADRPTEAVRPQLGLTIDGLRAGRLDGWFERGAAPEVAAAVKRLSARLGAGSVQLPGAQAARSAAFCLTAAEGGSLHLPNLRNRPGDFDPATRDRLIAGAMLPAHIIARAHRYRRRFLDEALALLDRYDILIAPATPFPAPPIGQATILLAGEEVSVRANAGLYTQPISFIGLPVLTVPLVEPGAMPVGVQLIAAPWREDLLFRVAARLEAEGLVGPRPTTFEAAA